MTYKTWLKRYLKGPGWPTRGTIVTVVWDDATYAQDVENSGLARATSLGIVVEATADYIKVAAEFFADKSVRDVSTIPSGMIVGVYALGGATIPTSPQSVLGASKRR